MFAKSDNTLLLRYIKVTREKRMRLQLRPILFSLISLSWKREMWRSAELGRSMCRVSQRRWSYAGSYSSVRTTTNTRPNKEKTRRAMENGSLWHGIDSDEPISFPFVISKGFSLGRRYPYRDGLLQMMLMLMSSRPFFWCRDRGWHEVHGGFFCACHGLQGKYPSFCYIRDNPWRPIQCPSHTKHIQYITCVTCLHQTVFIIECVAMWVFYWVCLFQSVIKNVVVQPNRRDPR